MSDNPDSPSAPDSGGASVDLEKLGRARDAIVAQLDKVVVGQREVIDQMLTAVFARGHCLLVGVPGLAKTLLVSSLAQTLSLSFKRIQFTPDLMPSDITGTEILQDDHETGRREFRFLPGPVFAHVILADEINRTPPKTQAALLEAMQEKRVSAGGHDHILEDPFFVLATQNPIEQEGTYPLPEAQLDRFLFDIRVQYPSRSEEIEIMRRVSGDFDPQLEHVLGRDEILELQALVRRAPVADHVFEYCASLVRATRPEDPEAPSFVREWLTYGAGPRASLFLVTAGKAHALLHGRAHVATEDVRSVALPILRHRLLTNFSARAEGVSSDDVVRRLLDEIPDDDRLYERRDAAAKVS